MSEALKRAAGSETVFELSNYLDAVKSLSLFTLMFVKASAHISCVECMNSRHPQMVNAGENHVFY